MFVCRIQREMIANGLRQRAGLLKFGWVMILPVNEGLKTREGLFFGYILSGLVDN